MTARRLFSLFALLFTIVTAAPAVGSDKGFAYNRLGVAFPHISHAVKSDNRVAHIIVHPMFFLSGLRGGILTDIGKTGSQRGVTHTPFYNYANPLEVVREEVMTLYGSGLGALRREPGSVDGYVKLSLAIGLAAELSSIKKRIAAGDMVIFALPKQPGIAQLSKEGFSKKRVELSNVTALVNDFARGAPQPGTVFFLETQSYDVGALTQEDIKQLSVMGIDAIHIYGEYMQQCVADAYASLFIYNRHGRESLTPGDLDHRKPNASTIFKKVVMEGKLSVNAPPLTAAMMGDYCKEDPAWKDGLLAGAADALKAMAWPPSSTFQELVGWIESPRTQAALGAYWRLQENTMVSSPLPADSGPNGFQAPYCIP